MDDTLFDKIIRKEIPSQVVFENDHALAFHDINPQAPIHVLVIPKKKMVSFRDVEGAESEDISAYFRAIATVASKLGLNENGYRVVFNHGQDGQQTVQYIHAHILGGKQLQWPPG